ncbi:hypothetical protein CADE109221_16175 [Castellaniella denitrificans]
MQRPDRQPSREGLGHEGVHHPYADPRRDQRADRERGIRFDHDVLLVVARPQPGAHRHHDVVVVVEQHQAVAPQMVQPQRPVGGERMAGRQHADGARPLQPGGNHGGVLDVARRQDEIDQALAEVVAQLGRAEGLQADVDPRVLPGEPRHDAGQQPGRQCRGAADAQDARARFPEHVHRGLDLFQALEVTPHGLVELAAFPRRAQASVIEIEQLQAGGRPEFGQAAADRGLGRVQDLGGAGGRAGFHDGLEGLDLLEIQGAGHGRAAGGDGISIMNSVCEK